VAPSTAAAAPPPPAPAAPQSGPTTASSAPVAAGAPTVTLQLPGGQTLTVSLGPNILANLPTGMHAVVVLDPIVTPPNQAAAGSLGGGNVVPLGAPSDIKLQITGDGDIAGFLKSIGDQTLELRLPVLAQPTDPSAQFAWLMEIADENGLFLGYIRVPATFDPATNSLVLQIPVSQFNGTLFLPAIIVPAYVQNFDANIHIYSSPFKEATDFGPAGPQYTTFTVVGPQVIDRVYVFNSTSNNYGWIDVAGVGPVAAP
jgi:hypothetical protein